MTTKSTFNPVVLKGKGFTIFILILLATLALTAIAVYSQVSNGKIVTNGFVAGESFATNEKLSLGHGATIGPDSSLAPNRKPVLGSRGGVGPAWHHGPRVSIANPPVAEVDQ